jgi:hypothetical protein
MKPGENHECAVSHSFALSATALAAPAIARSTTGFDAFEQGPLRENPPETTHRRQQPLHADDRPRHRAHEMGHQWRARRNGKPGRPDDKDTTAGNGAVNLGVATGACPYRLRWREK